LTLRPDQVAHRLGVTSITAHARYKQGRPIPPVQKLSHLVAAVSPHLMRPAILLTGARSRNSRQPCKTG
jgi:hypothetical protein